LAGASPQTLLRELTALPQAPLAGFKGPTSKGREKKGGKGKGAEGKEGKERDGKGRGGNVQFHHLLLSNLTTGSAVQLYTTSGSGVLC